MIKTKLNESNAKVMAELAVKGLREEFLIIDHPDNVKEYPKGIKYYTKRKASLIDCLERLEMNDLIKEIQ